jgi:hypothetical protein
MIHYTVKRVRVHKYTRAEALAHMHTQHTKMFAERERERETDRQAGRQTDTHRDRTCQQQDRHCGRQTDTLTHREVEDEVLGVVLLQVGLADLAVNLAHGHLVDHGLPFPGASATHSPPPCLCTKAAAPRTGCDTAGGCSTWLLAAFSLRRRASNSESLMMGLPSAYLLAATCASSSTDQGRTPRTGQQLSVCATTDTGRGRTRWPRTGQQGARP